MKKIIILPLLFLFTMSALAQNLPSLQGSWKGGISIQGNKLPITTHFTGDDSLRGTIDIQGATLPLQNISVTESDSAFFEFATAVNVAKFKGMLQHDSTISGQYLQAGQQFSFKLQRFKPKQKAMSEKSYSQKDLIIKNDSIDIGGTLTWPKDEQANQLVIIISGSGAQDRDGTMKPVTDFQPYAVLADSLTAAGIATFRYDDRGVGQSTGNFGNATLNILADDVDAIITELSAMKNHNFNKITLLGHSQGSVVGGKVAAENKDVNKLILMASTGVSLKEVLRFQVLQSFTQAGIDSTLIENEISARENLMQAIADDSEVDEARKRYRQQFKAIQLSAGVDSAQATAAAQRQATQLAATFEAPQTLSLLSYNPASDLGQLNIPVLVLFGGKDTQVTIEMNKEPIEKTLTSSSVKHQIEIFSDANHLFQKAKTGQMNEYGSLANQFVDGFTSTISRWIKK